MPTRLRTESSLQRNMQIWFASRTRPHTREKKERMPHTGELSGSCTGKKKGESIRNKIHSGSAVMQAY